MKNVGIISGIKRMEIHDGDGLRTTVFFKGCPLKCVWCHNPESIGYKPQLALFQNKCVGCKSCESVCESGAIKVGESGAVVDRAKCKSCFACTGICPTEAAYKYGREYSIDELFDEVMLDAPFFEAGKGGVTLSGGECLAQPDFAIGLAQKFFENGISVDIDTCGYVSREILERIIPFTDTFLYDIKAVDPKVHATCTGRDNGIILENLRFLSKSGCSIEVRYPFVVGKNDGECESIASLLEGMEGIVGIKVLKYHDLSSSRYFALGLEDTLPEPITTDEAVERARAIMRKHGLKVKI